MLGFNAFRDHRDEKRSTVSIAQLAIVFFRQKLARKVAQLEIQNFLNRNRTRGGTKRALGWLRASCHDFKFENFGFYTQHAN